MSEVNPSREAKTIDQMDHDADGERDRTQLWLVEMDFLDRSHAHGRFPKFAIKSSHIEYGVSPNDEDLKQIPDVSRLEIITDGTEPSTKDIQDALYSMLKTSGVNFGYDDKTVKLPSMEFNPGDGRGIQEYHISGSHLIQISSSIPPDIFWVTITWVHSE